MALSATFMISTDPMAYTQYMLNFKNEKNTNSLFAISGSKNRFAFWKNVMVGFFILKIIYLLLQEIILDYDANLDDRAVETIQQILTGWQKKNNS